MKRLFLSFFLLFLLLIFSTNNIFAKIGVGVGSGKIVVDEDLKPGVIYELPSLSVVNTGDVASEYGVTVTYHEAQPEIEPPETWFDFSPKTFSLEPGEIQEVKINLDLPVRAEPGEYFAYLEAYPVTKSEAGTTSIGIAAATKLYFTVVPGNFIEGLYYKILSTWRLNSSWLQPLAIITLVLAVMFIAKRFLNIQIQVGKKDIPGSRRERIKQKDQENVEE